jgi:hypothetical protein
MLDRGQIGYPCHTQPASHRHARLRDWGRSLEALTRTSIGLGGPDVFHRVLKDLVHPDREEQADGKGDPLQRLQDGAARESNGRRCVLRCLVLQGPSGLREAVSGGEGDGDRTPQRGGGQALPRAAMILGDRGVGLLEVFLQEGQADDAQEEECAGRGEDGEEDLLLECQGDVDERLDRRNINIHPRGKPNGQLLRRTSGGGIACKRIGGSPANPCDA